MSVWDERAERYRTSEAHRSGEDLDLLVEWARGARTALDVATGGGHVARRLRDAGIEVVSADPSPGMQPDVVCRAEDIPFADESFDLVTCRVAPHHFEDVRAAVGEMARVAREHVLVVDNLYVDNRSEEADRLRDPSHVRNYGEDEWRELLRTSGLVLDDVRILEHEIDFEAWLERVGCTGPDAERVREMLGERVEDGRLRLPRIALRGRKERA